eukprot:2407986-Pyramimonas_sp.AAC.1
MDVRILNGAHKAADFADACKRVKSVILTVWLACPSHNPFSSFLFWFQLHLPQHSMWRMRAYVWRLQVLTRTIGITNQKYTLVMGQRPSLSAGIHTSSPSSASAPASASASIIRLLPPSPSASTPAASASMLRWSFTFHDLPNELTRSNNSAYWKPTLTCSWNLFTTLADCSRKPKRRK